MPPMTGSTAASNSSSVRESAGKPAVRAIRASVLASLLITIISSEAGVREEEEDGESVGRASGRRNDAGLRWERPRRRFLGTEKER